MIAFFKNFLTVHCIICGTATKHPSTVCDSCLEKLPWQKNVCRLCNLSLASTETDCCGSCQQQPPLHQNMITAFRYEAPINHWITGLKFQKKLHYAHTLATLLLEKLASIDMPEVLIPVPLHPKRIYQRGFNQALELAKILGKKYDRPVLKTALIREIYTEPQSILSLRDREKNIQASVFQLIRHIPYQSIALIDDVITTGATVNACAQALSTDSGKKISVFGIARTVLS